MRWLKHEPVRVAIIVVPVSGDPGVSRATGTTRVTRAVSAGRVMARVFAIPTSSLKLTGRITDLLYISSYWTVTIVFRNLWN